MWPLAGPNFWSLVFCFNTCWQNLFQNITFWATSWPLRSVQIWPFWRSKFARYPMFCTEKWLKFGLFGFSIWPKFGFFSIADWLALFNSAGSIREIRESRVTAHFGKCWESAHDSRTEKGATCESKKEPLANRKKSRFLPYKTRFFMCFYKYFLQNW